MESCLLVERTRGGLVEGASAFWGLAGCAGDLLLRPTGQSSGSVVGVGHGAAGECLNVPVPSGWVSEESGGRAEDRAGWGLGHRICWGWSWAPGWGADRSRRVCEGE